MSDVSGPTDVASEPLTPPPDWFVRSLAVPYSDGRVEVDGCSIHYLAWGDPGRQGIVFVHGGGAHAHWWTHIAANFAEEFRVVAIDLSGHGDSGRREHYSLELWTEEVMSAAADGGITGRPVVVGHSMGGFVTVATAAIHGEDLAGVIVCDSPVTEPDPEVTSYRLKEAFGNPRTYPTKAAGMAHFRTVPAQAHYLDFVMANVAAHSLAEVDGGFRWKFDEQVFAQFMGSMRGIALPYMSHVKCRLALLRSEYGLVTKEIGESMYEVLGRSAPVVELPEAGHHMMLDEPLVLLTAIRALLADWQHSNPSRPGH